MSRTPEQPWIEGAPDPKRRPAMRPTVQPTTGAHDRMLIEGEPEALVQHRDPDPSGNPDHPAFTYDGIEIE